VHADVAARQGKGVEGGVAQGEELEVAARLGGGRGQAGAQRIQIGGDLDIVDVGRLAQADVAHDRLADAPLHLRRQVGAEASPRSGRPSARTAGARQASNSSTEFISI
jgi:hypothetical protein